MVNKNILSRKFLLKLAKNPSAQELLKKHFGKITDRTKPVFKALIERDIVPIISVRDGDFDAQLGSGAFSDVYEVSYKGKLAVAKITKSERDFDVTLALDALKPKLGEDAKHLPKIYDNFSMKLGYDTYYVLIVEKLQPINDHIIDWIYPYSSGPKFNIARNNLDAAHVMGELNDYLNELEEWKEFPNQFRIGLLEETEKYLRKAATKTDNIYTFITIIRNALFDYAKRSFNNIGQDIELSEAEDIIKYTIIDKIKEIMEMNIEFPYSEKENYSKQDIEHFKNSPETRSFMKFLLRLKNEFGIKWADLHGGNIMIRPSTGDLIASDVGLFKMPEPGL